MLEDYTLKDYKFKGLPLTPAIADHIITSQLVGQQKRRSAIVSAVEKFHINSGGLPCEAADVSRTVKHALNTIKERGGAENPSTGWWRILGEPVKNSEDSELLEYSSSFSTEADEIPQRLKPLHSLGDGEESVYLYYYPAYKNAAIASGHTKWLCKIGRTDSGAEIRIAGQSTGMPERPEVSLVYRTGDSRALESALHGILTLRNQWSEDSPGSEWFFTSPDDVISIIEQIFNVERLHDSH